MAVDLSQFGRPRRRPSCVIELAADRVEVQAISLDKGVKTKQLLVVINTEDGDDPRHVVYAIPLHPATLVQIGEALIARAPSDTAIAEMMAAEEAAYQRKQTERKAMLPGDAEAPGFVPSELADPTDAAQVPTDHETAQANADAILQARKAAGEDDPEN